jgi:hypothetical protein
VQVRWPKTNAPSAPGPNWGPSSAWQGRRGKCSHGVVGLLCPAVPLLGLFKRLEGAIGALNQKWCR